MHKSYTLTVKSKEKESFLYTDSPKQALYYLTHLEASGNWDVVRVTQGGQLVSKEELNARIS